MKKIFKYGFTLVELLVVVALIGILAVAVISTINPIEQANRARDAQFKNDAAELVNAEERYYAANQAYPWSYSNGPCDPSGGNKTGSAFFSIGWTTGSDPAIGVCAVSGACSSNNVGCLVNSLELRTEFANRATFKVAPGTLPNPTYDAIYVARGPGPSDTFYACFIPKSQASQTAWSNLSIISLSGSLSSGGAPGACPSKPDWSSSYCYTCVPQ